MYWKWFNQFHIFLLKSMFCLKDKNVQIWHTKGHFTLLDSLPDLYWARSYYLHFGWHLPVHLSSSEDSVLSTRIDILLIVIMPGTKYKFKKFKLVVLNLVLIVTKYKWF